MTRAEALEAIAVGPAGRCRRHARDGRRPPRDRRDGDRQHDGRQCAGGGLHRRVRRVRDRPRAPASTTTGRRRKVDGDRTRARASSRPTRPTRSASSPRVGGLEIAALVGVIVESRRSARVPVVLDGFITGVGRARRRGDRSGRRGRASSPAIAPSEPGHAIVLEHLGLRPILELDLRLGEGSGAALAMGVIAAAVAVRDGMATFDAAGVGRPVVTTDRPRPARGDDLVGPPLLRPCRPAALGGRATRRPRSSRPSWRRPCRRVSGSCRARAVARRATAAAIAGG